MILKEPFFTIKNINSQANIIAEQVKIFRKRHPILVNKKKIALLVLDMQKFFADEKSHAFIPSIAAILPNIQKLQDFFLAEGLSVFHTRHANTKENAGQMAKWWNASLLSAQDPLADLIPEILNPSIKVVTKTQYDAFWQTELARELKVCGAEQLIISGVMTHLCCETTARAAFVRGFEVFFTIDATATYNLDFHLGSLRNLAHGFAIPVLVDEIIEQLAK